MSNFANFRTSDFIFLYFLRPGLDHRDERPGFARKTDKRIRTPSVLPAPLGSSESKKTESQSLTASHRATFLAERREGAVAGRATEEREPPHFCYPDIHRVIY